MTSEDSNSLQIHCKVLNFNILYDDLRPSSNSRLRDYLSDNFRKFGSAKKIRKLLNTAYARFLFTFSVKNTCSRMNPTLIKTEQ